MKTTQNKSILQHMQNGYKITALEALGHYGCMRLASRINDLKRMGHIIHDEWVTRNGKRYKSYYMEVK